MSSIVKVPTNTPPKAMERISGLMGRLDRIRAEQQAATAMVMHGVGASAGGALLGFVEGRYDRTEIQGIPFGIVAAVASHGLALTTRDGATFLHGMGDGALAVETYKLALRAGRDARARAED